MAEKEKKELKNDYVKKGVELEPIMILVKKGSFKRVWDEKAGKSSDEIALRPYKHNGQETVKDGKVQQYATFEVPPIGDLNMKPTFITVHEACIRKPKTVTERMKDNGMDLNNCVYVVLPRSLAANGKEESNTVKGYQVTGKDKEGKNVYANFQINPTAVEKAMPRYMSNKQKENYKAKSDGKLLERVMFKPVFIIPKEKVADLAIEEKKEEKTTKKAKGRGK